MTEDIKTDTPARSKDYFGRDESIIRKQVLNNTIEDDRKFADAMFLAIVQGRAQSLNLSSTDFQSIWSIVGKALEVRREAMDHLNIVPGYLQMPS